MTAGTNCVTGLPWSPATDCLRNITGEAACSASSDSPRGRRLTNFPRRGTRLACIAQQNFAREKSNIRNTTLS